jgi:2-oxoglutarate ferredoxin oxidoreductase subunit gamma
MKIRFSGLGGQGIVMSGFILGKAAALDGYNVIQTQTYGSAYRGMIGKSDVIISKQQIYEIEFNDPDTLVVFSQDAYNKYHKTLKKEGILLMNEDLIKSEKINYKRYSIPITTLSNQKFGKKIYANIIMLGYLSAIVQPVSKSSFIKSITETVPKGTSKENLNAFEFGYKQGAEDKKNRII